MKRLLRRVRNARVPRPTLRGLGLVAAAIAALAVAYATGRRELLFVSMLLLALPLLAAAYVLVGRARLGVTRIFDSAIVEAGRPAAVRVTVQNRAALAATPLVWRDVLPSGATPAGLLPALEGGLFAPDRVGGQRMVRYTLTPGRRGVYPIGPLLIDEQDPLRLCSMRHAVGGSDDLVVTPRITSLPQGKLRHALTDGTSHRVDHRSSAGEDDLITREYQLGDPLRRVHWRATARHGELMVRQEEQRSNPEAMVLLDSDSRHYPGADARSSDAFERAVELAASVALHLRAAGCGVQVIETARPTASYLHARDSASGDGERALLVRLAEIDLRDARGERDFATRASAELHRSGSSVPLIAVFGALDAGETASVAALRRWCEPAIAFLAHDSGGTARALTAAGWLCVDLDRTPDLAAAWAAIDASAVTHDRV
ncbi:DUF58 domain-containing protein [Planctomonas psychrotolerans]|uniref:DUF58 domain-containing protein n=1 Tax=Planctomonas psychrotolerans TaxID=2528712 RepID=UPI001238BED6|nr:DUF58 domain-containing protein [Planctomonas psychrotolerans]